MSVQVHLTTSAGGGILYIVMSSIYSKSSCYSQCITEPMTDLYVCVEYDAICAM